MSDRDERDTASCNDLDNQEPEERALCYCHELLRIKLEVRAIFPYLNQRDLLTRHDKDTLQNRSFTNDEKVDYLVHNLPTKGKNWWNLFISSLRRSSQGTGHGDLADKLELNRNLLIQSGSAHGAAPGLVERRISTHVPSGVSRSIHKIILETPPIPRLCPDIAEDMRPIIQPIVELKNELDIVKYNHKVMLNQVGLMRSCEELIQNTKDFSIALSDLIKYYIDNFKKRKRDADSRALLTPIELEIIQIIEEITECTEDIDMSKEKEEWAKCIRTMEKWMTVLKDALYSEEINKMAEIQKAWKLKGKETENAHEWICKRRKVIDMGKHYLSRLQKMCSEKTILLKSMYDIIDHRVKVGDRCLAAWIDWINMRTKL